MDARVNHKKMVMQVMICSLLFISTMFLSSHLIRSPSSSSSSDDGIDHELIHQYSGGISSFGGYKGRGNNQPQFTPSAIPQPTSQVSPNQGQQQKQPQVIVVNYTPGPEQVAPTAQPTPQPKNSGPIVIVLQKQTPSPAPTQMVSPTQQQPQNQPRISRNKPGEVFFPPLALFPSFIAPPTPKKEPLRAPPQPPKTNRPVPVQSSVDVYGDQDGSDIVDVSF
uniref:Uncharacterized protein n=1 Tax=Timspurckia oligopyrenoides TaxID=708627 RepID=A0A7S0ZGQ3_9RHOD|mmetsp:Transcript_4531/g.7932  ORF Transcript_4531/g.7932 Transcript_4531/m.7932 type:complete len:222 (+) Transcript_4531:762-1427(+)